MLLVYPDCNVAFYFSVLVPLCPPSFHCFTLFYFIPEKSMDEVIFDVEEMKFMFYDTECSVFQVNTEACCIL